MPPGLTGRMMGHSPFTITRILAAGVIAAALVAGCSGTKPKAATSKAAAEDPADSGNLLVTGRSIDPQASASAQDVGSFPINMVLAPGGRFAVTTSQGFRQTLWSLRTEDGKGASHVSFPKKQLDAAYGLYYGLAFAADGTLYAAQGAEDAIAVLKMDDAGKLRTIRRFPTRKGDFPSGLGLDGRGLLYVVNNDPASPNSA